MVPAHLLMSIAAAAKGVHQLIGIRPAGKTFHGLDKIGMTDRRC